MPDCEHPKCHEEVHIKLKEKADKSCIGKLLPKKSVWAAIPIMLVLGAMAIGAADYKYAKQSEIADCRENQSKLDSTVKHMNEDIRDIKASSHETRKDVKEILRYMRNDRPNR
jgi:hypothetical protein